MCFLQCPNKHLVWCLSVIKRDIPRGVVQISGVKHIRRSEGRIPHAMPNTWHSIVHVLMEHRTHKPDRIVSGINGYTTPVRPVMSESLKTYWDDHRKFREAT